MTISVMIDLETWGTTPGSDIRSIGACVFDPMTGFAPVAGGEHFQHSGTFYIACDNPVIHIGSAEDAEPVGWKYPLTRDPRTVQWWSEQSDEARAAFANPIDLRDALQRFTSWIINMYPASWDGKLSSEILIWSHGPSFDVSILSAAYRAVGLPEPWHYRAPRDTRTAFDMAGIDDHSAWLDQHSTGTHHHALSDAICQARAVCGAYEKLRIATSSLCGVNTAEQ